ncbi:MAG: hypothetical protein H7Y07_09645, partial [Pyrinomonadaceae bacterium]|nr:hypothetical protein [Sphingobacteriaceae bacterium]
ILQLTNNSTNQKGHIYIDIPFSSTYGLTASFEYFHYGGTGADGLAFFLFDAAVPASSFRIGAFGGSLGYAPRVTGTTNEPGLNGAYMGVGFDEYGNFGINSEGKTGGMGGGLAPNSVAIRGPESTGYEYVDGIRTNTAPLNFTIGSPAATRVTNPASAGYRKVYIELQPQTIGYTVIVKMDIGGVGTQTVLTTNYPYPAPASLKIGFAASTGGSTNYHEIDNIAIGVSNIGALINPTANNDNVSICDGSSSVSVSVLSNDVLENAAPTYFDLTKFDLDPLTAGIQTTFTVAGKGTFTANADGTVTFTKIAGFASGLAEVDYTITDNYNKTSNQAKLIVNVSSIPVLVVNANLSDCITVDLRTAITSDLTGLTISYSKLESGIKVSKTLAQISNLGIADNGTYYIKAVNAAGCEIEQTVQVTVNAKPAKPGINLLP